MKKVLVTGATGFVGNYVVEDLISKGFHVIASSTQRSKASSYKWFTKVEYVEFDLKDYQQNQDYFRFFQSPDLMIHLAWEGLPNYKDDFHVKENLPRHFNFLKNLIENGVKDLTVSGTCLEYGLKEGLLSEDMPAEPSNPYAFAKNELRKELEELSNSIAVNFKWIRLFYMYGKGQNAKSLISQLDKAIEDNEPVFNMSGGEQVRDFLPVEKVARNIVSIATQDKIKGIINCCSGVPIKVKDFVEQYLKEKNKKIDLNLGYYNYTDYEPMRFWGDTNKLKQAINNE